MPTQELTKAEEKYEKDLRAYRRARANFEQIDKERDRNTQKDIMLSAKLHDHPYSKKLLSKIKFNTKQAFKIEKTWDHARAVMDSAKDKVLTPAEQEIKKLHYLWWGINKF